jgi:hypothetical protein
MLGSAVRRCIRYLVVLLPVALYTGQAAGQSPTQCPNSPAAPAPAFYVAAEQTQVVPTALETQIWKTDLTDILGQRDRDYCIDALRSR